MNDPYSKFKELLETTYLFPTTYIHKIIGRKSPEFEASLTEFEGKFMGLTRTGQKETASGKHLALTYSFIAGSSSDIVELTKQTKEIRDLLFIL